MQTKTEPTSIPDADNPEWTSETFARAKRIGELPALLRSALTRQAPETQSADTKTTVSVRLSSDVLSALKARGDGWQTLVDDTLREHFVTKP